MIIMEVFGYENLVDTTRLKWLITVLDVFFLSVMCFCDVIMPTIWLNKSKKRAFFVLFAY